MAPGFSSMDCPVSDLGIRGWLIHARSNRLDYKLDYQWLSFKDTIKGIKSSCEKADPKLRETSLP